MDLGSSESDDDGMVTKFANSSDVDDGFRICSCRDDGAWMNADANCDDSDVRRRARSRDSRGWLELETIRLRL